MHYIDANDSPLSGSCSVSDARDCDGACILTGSYINVAFLNQFVCSLFYKGITNYTSRVSNSALSSMHHNLPCLTQTKTNHFILIASERDIALKFISAFAAGWSCRINVFNSDDQLILSATLDNLFIVRLMRLAETI